MNGREQNVMNSVHVITAMPAYESESFEELRLKAYQKKVNYRAQYYSDLMRDKLQIDLSYKDISPEDAASIAEVLKENTTLTHIDLGYNRIGPGGAKAIADSLKVNRTVTSLIMWGNKIGNEGAHDIADVIKVNDQISNLDIHGNEIGEAGLSSIADVLRGKTSLKTIDVSFNRQSKHTITAIAEALKVNPEISNIEGVSLNSFECRSILELPDSFDGKSNNEILQHLRHQINPSDASISGSESVSYSI